VLVVDDDAPIRNLLAFAIEHELGVTVGTARDGYDALARVREQRPSVVLMDLMMPGLDGFEATRRLRSDPETADAYVIAMTASGASPAEARAAGADAYLAKPFELEAVLTQVGAALARRRELAR
jgi:two-component system response regulator MtrA